jgi:lipopolysaccharide transport system ATP-binding protein
MRPIIQVEKLGKRYRIGTSGPRYGTLRDSVTQTLSAPFKRFRRNRNGHLTSDLRSLTSGDSIWALKDVSFEVMPGEVVGIIGRNGAGKSTLLKVLSRITEPTTGAVDIYGRVSSLLEVGTGFHPELTGRENIFLNGAILGMRRAEIEDKFDEIVAFAEVDKFLDTQVKHYSTGMRLRLAFAVAAHLEPEILVIDEVLAVGDAQFQKKCLGKMGEVSKQGRTVLFVSHNMTAVKNLCHRCVWLNEGRVIEDGPTERVVSNYLKTSFSPLTEQVWDDFDSAPGGETVRLHRVAVQPEGGTPYDPITVRTPIVMEFEYWNHEPGAYLNLSLHILNEEGTIVFNAVPIREPDWESQPFPIGLFRSTCLVPGDLMNNGLHRVEILLVKNQQTMLFQSEDILIFEVADVVDEKTAWHGGWPGATRPALKWNTERINAAISRNRPIGMNE